MFVDGGLHGAWALGLVETRTFYDRALMGGGGLGGERDD